MEEEYGAGKGAAGAGVERAGEGGALRFLVRLLSEELELGLCGLVRDKTTK